MKWVRVLLAVAAVALLTTAALAAPGSGYDLSWWSADGGGGTLVKDGYTLSGTAGQPDAGAVSAGAYVLQSGFWSSGSMTWTYRVYLPLVAH